MRFTHFTDLNEEKNVFYTTSHVGFGIELESEAEKEGYHIVTHLEKNTTGEPETLKISSVHDVGKGGLLDERHTTVFEAEVYESDLSQSEEIVGQIEESELVEKSEFNSLYRVVIPNFSRLVKRLHSNVGHNVFSPIEDDVSRRNITQSLQKKIVQSQICTAQLFDDNCFRLDEPLIYENLYPNIQEQREGFGQKIVQMKTDNASDSEEFMRGLVEGFESGVMESWNDIFEIPYSSYKNRLFDSYYSDDYEVNKLFWLQTELEQEMGESLSQCYACGAIRLPEELETGVCISDECIER